MRNPHLYKALKDYCEAALSLLKARLKGPEDLPFVPKEKFEITGPGSWSMSESPEVEWILLVAKYEQDIKQLENYLRATQAMETDARLAIHLNTLVGPGSWMARVDTDSILTSLLSELLSDQGSLNFQEAAFNSVYERIENYFYQDVLKYRCLSPLDGFRMEAERVDLSHQLSIVRITKEEQEQMLSHARRLGFILGQAVTMSDYAFECYTEMPKIIGSADSVPQENWPSEIARSNFDEACLALRLFKSGRVGYDYVRIENTAWEPYGGISTIGPTAPRWFSGPPHVLSTEEIPVFSKFWRLYQQARQAKQRRKRIEIALRRFNFGYERVRAEDRLIDCLIGFEALLLGRNERQELEYRLALRGSTLLGKDSEDRKRIFAELKKAYGLRSDIVHGGEVEEAVSIDSEKVPFDQFAEKIEGHLRSALWKFLMLCEKQSENQVIDSLDERIVAGLQSQEEMCVEPACPPKN